MRQQVIPQEYKEYLLGVFDVLKEHKECLQSIRNPVRVTRRKEDSSTGLYWKEATSRTEVYDWRTQVRALLQVKENDLSSIESGSEHPLLFL